MRDVDERVAAVQGRVRRIKRKRERAVVGAVTACAVLACVGLVGMPIATGQVADLPGAATLFGASSLFGPSAGGYVLVALVTAVVVALVTVLCVTRSRSGKEDAETVQLGDFSDCAENEICDQKQQG